MLDAFIGALALLLILEGLLPFLSPVRWREMFARAMTLSDGQLRFIGLTSLLAGVLLLLVWL